MNPSKKIILFFDELPWLATKRSLLLQNLDYFWNTKWSRMPQVKLIVCGSSASWIINNLINAKGGLHNRLTKTILLEPFDLPETKLFLKSRGIKLNNKHILDIYMAMGGVAHYLNQIEKSKSAIQNINDICFKKTGLLYQEFPRLFKSLFDSADLNLKIFQEIAKKREGISRDELLKKVKLKSGRTFNLRLQELEASGFIKSITPYGNSKKGLSYRVSDEYSLFYFQWIAPFVSAKSIHDLNYWQTKSQTPSFKTWAGYAFESVCFKHAHLIKKDLGLDKIHCETGSLRIFSSKGKNHAFNQGAQIDLLFDRSDGVISLCEIKYSMDEFTIDKSYGKELLNKIESFKEFYLTKKQVFISFISTYGLKKNIWSKELVDAEIKFLDLF